MTAREVIDLLEKNLGIPWNAKGFRDTFKVGNPDVQVKGVATTCMSTLAEIQRAHAADLNLVISHEPTFWSDTDETVTIANDPTYKAKNEYCQKNDMVVWRFHDNWHAKKPDIEGWGTLRVLGLAPQNYADYKGPLSVYTIEPTTLSELVSRVKKQLGVHALRVVGDPKAKVSRLTVGVGSGMPSLSADVDVAIGGEGIESDGNFDNTEYARDATALGMSKGLIILGHVISEEPGMEYCAEWMRTFLKDIPIKFIPAKEPFWA
jgi:putative NIF3 family GTP cyclohydrolase 1 type 2